jgi:hypothetical protein
MKRLLLITLIVITCVLAGVLHGGYMQEEGEGDTSTGQVYPGHFPEKMPDIIFDSTVLPSPLL